MTTRISPLPGVGGRTVAATDRANPVLVICALAWKGNPLLGLDATEYYARSVLESTFREHSRDEILSWRRNFIASEQQNRWRAAKRWAIDLLGVPGAEHLPDDPRPTEREPNTPKNQADSEIETS